MPTQPFALRPPRYSRLPRRRRPPRRRRRYASTVPRSTARSLALAHLDTPGAHTLMCGPLLSLPPPTRPIAHNETPRPPTLTTPVHPPFSNRPVTGRPEEEINLFFGRSFAATSCCHGPSLRTSSWVALGDTNTNLVQQHHPTPLVEASTWVRAPRGVMYMPLACARSVGVVGRGHCRGPTPMHAR